MMVEILTDTMVLRGEIVKQVVKQSGFKFSEVSKQLHLSRSTLHRRLAEENLDWNLIRQVGKILKYDFSKEFYEMPGELAKMGVIEYEQPEFLDAAKLESLPDCIRELLEMQRKYISLLERHNTFVEAFSVLSSKSTKKR